MAHRTLLALTLGVLPLSLACGDKDDGDGTTETDGGTTVETCELELASAGTVDNAECEALVDVLLGMEAQWQWEYDTTYTDYNDLLGTPVVGDVDGDGVAEVVFVAAASTYYDYPGVLIVLDGETGEQEQMFDIIGDKEDYFAGGGGVALADLDADGVVEILVTTSAGSLVAYHADGTEVFLTADRADDVLYWTAPAVGDLDGDGHAEVAMGRSVFDSSGGFEEGSDIEGWGGLSYSSIIADLDGDGTPEVISGNHAFHLDGSLVFDASKDVDDGAPAVGDFDGDGQGEIVMVSYYYGTATMLDTDGSLMWEVTLWEPATKKHSGGGGLPSVADFDGDGKLEIVIPGADSVVMLDDSGNIEWEVPLDGNYFWWGGVTGFDFDDDGVIEVVATDYYGLYVLDGDSGELIMQSDQVSTANIMGYPVVADVDGDNIAEIIVGTNSPKDKTDFEGVVALRDIYDSWAPGPTAYTQNAWHPGVLEGDLTAPTSPQMPWDGGDDLFRVSPNGERGEVYASAPNLVSELTDSCFECSATLVRFEVAVQAANIGGLDVDEDFAVGIYGVTAEGRRELIDTAKMEGGLAAGQSTEGVRLYGQFAASVGFVAIEAQVDGSEIRGTEHIGARGYLDCDADDNIDRLEIPCD